MKQSTNSKELILHTALSLFASRGYDAVGVNEIVETAGITKPTLYYFFQSKEGVFREILCQNYEKFFLELKQICVYHPDTQNYERDVFPVLLQTVNFYFQFAMQHREFFQLALSLFHAPPTSVSARLARPYYEEQHRIIFGMFTDISFVHKNLKGKEAQTAGSFSGIIDTAISYWFHGVGALTEERAKAIVHQFMHGIFA